MADQKKAGEPDWPTCGTPGCIGIRVKDAEACLTHVEPQAHKAFLAALRPGVDLDVRGTSIDPELLSGLLAAVRSEDGPPTLGNAQFDRAQFSGAAWFHEVQFSGAAGFNEVQFSGAAGFHGAQFSGAAWFDEAQFSGAAVFDTARFSGIAWFREAQFSGKNARFHKAQFGGTAGFDETQFGEEAGFREAQFGEAAGFHKAQFSGDAGFDGAQFSELALFGKAQFSGDAWFHGAQFGGNAGFHGAQFSEDAGFNTAQFSELARFGEAQFKRAGTFGPVLAVSSLILDRTTFEQDIRIEVVGGELSCVGTRFAEAASLRLRRTQVVLDGAVFAKPSTIAFAPTPSRARAKTRALTGKSRRSGKIRLCRPRGPARLGRSCYRCAGWMWQPSH